MKEKEFMDKLSKINFDEGLIIPVYFGFDDNENVIVDWDSMKEEFNIKLGEIKEILEPKDELTEIVKEKVRMINEERKKKVEGEK